MCVAFGQERAESMTTGGIRTGVFAAAFAAVALASAPVYADEADAPLAEAEPVTTSPAWYRQFTFGSEKRSPSDTAPMLWSDEERDYNLSWSATGRLQLHFGMANRPDESPLPRSEVSAGASYDITPRLSLGGQFRVGSDDLEAASRNDQRDVEAGIELRSSFKF